MSFACTPLKGSPPATLATCYWGKRPIIIHTHTHTRAQWKQHKYLFKAIVKHKDWGQDVDPFPSTVRTPLKDLHSSYSSPVYPNNLFVTFLLLLSSSAHVPSLHKVSFEFSEWYRHPEDWASWSFSLREGVVSPTEDGRRKMSVTLQHFFKAMDGERGQGYCSVNIQSRVLNSPTFSEEKIWE